MISDKSMARNAALVAASGAEINAEDMLDYIDELADGDLADIGAQIKKSRDALAKVDKALKQRIITCANGATQLCGNEFNAKLVYKVVWRLDTKKVKTDMGAEWYDERSKPSDQVRIEYGI